MSYQKVIIVGNLGRDPEMRYMPDGTPVTSFSVATNRKWTNTDGSQGEETVWFRVSVWRRQAETVAQYLTKGRQVMIEGRLTADKATGGPRIWTAQDGTPRASYELTADRVVFLSGRGDATPGGGEGVDGPIIEDDDVIPF
ncbi:MAG: single-stranded DNA-binding protein [Anaerolineae bacterium]|jgi:single-strand DNA-binding protein|nr:single-stranded DNA-binding protein [Anaerolineae bacterium]